MKRVGIDVGGTFTDVVVVDEETGLTTCHKAPTDRYQPADGIMAAYSSVNVAGSDISHVRVGTTLGLNALLTRSGPLTGLLTTAGFRDVLEIRRTHRERLYDLDEKIAPPLVDRPFRLEIAERIGAEGEVVVPLDEDSVRRAWATLRDAGVTSVAVSFLFSFKNPAHERLARGVIEREGGAEYIFLSSDVLPVVREYERTSTVTTAAYIAPVIGDFINDLESKLTSAGVQAGRLSVLTNSGGSMSSEGVARMPIPTLMSGPAGGVTAARWLAREEGISQVLTLDMGGTSCDLSGIQDDVPDERLDMRIAGLDVAYPTFDIHTIGAGGGSIAWIDSGGALRVGPRSAGSTPGPACYGRGGTLPTVTDANLVLGRYGSATQLGGYMSLDLESARRVIDVEVAEPLGLTIEEAAAGIIRLVNSNMMNAARAISVERGRDPREYALVPFGGGGPVHAVDIASELRMSMVIIPQFPGCTSAFGATIARARKDALRSVNLMMDDAECSNVNETIRSLHGAVRDSLSREGYEAESVTCEVIGAMRYRGQAHELSISHEGLVCTEGSLKALRRRFIDSHALKYGHSFEDVPVELVTLRVTGFGPDDFPSIRWNWGAGHEDTSFETRPVWIDAKHGWVETPVIDRQSLRVNEPREGPLIINQDDATTLVPVGWSVTSRGSGSMVITHNGIGG